MKLPFQLEQELAKLGVVPAKAPPPKVVADDVTAWKPAYDGQEPPW